MYKISGFKSTQSNPRHDIDPKLKLEADWHKQVAEYIYAYHQGSWLQKRQDEFETLRRYARGDQDTEQYKSIFIGKESSNNAGSIGTEMGPSTNSTEYYDLANHRMGFANIDYSQIFSPAPNMMETIQGIMSSQRTTMRVYAKDQNSNNDRKAIEYSIKARMLYKDLFDSFAKIIGDQDQQGPIPSTLEELQMLISLGGFTLPYEIAMQQALDYTLNHESASKELCDQVIYDFASIGMSATRDMVDEFHQRAEFEYVDPQNLIIESKEGQRSFKNPLFHGIQRIISVFELRMESDFSEDKIHKIAFTYNGNSDLGNPSIGMDSIEKYSQTGNCNYNDIRIPIMDYEYLTVDSKYFTDVKSKTGDEFTVEEPYRDNGKKMPRTHDTFTRKTRKGDLKTRYNGSWILGTEYVYNFGRKNDQAFDNEMKESRSSLHFHCLPFPSIIKQCKPIFNDIQLLYLRYQNDKATAPPANSVALELGSLNDLKIGSKKLHPFDTVKIRFQSGILFYNLHKPALPGNMNQFNNVVPFQDLPGGIGKAITDFVSGISCSYQQLAVISGIDRVTMNSATPTGETTATQINSGITATKDTLKHLYQGWNSLQEDLSRTLLIQIQQLIITNNDESRGYYGVLSKPKILAVKEAGTTVPAEYGLEIMAMPTDDEINAINEAAQKATASGKNGIPAITYSEYLFIFDALKTGVPFKQIIAYINYKERMRDAQDAQMSAQSMEMNTKNSIDVENNKSKVSKELVTHETNEAIRLAAVSAVIDTYSQKSVNAAEAESNIKRLQVELGFKMAQELNTQGAEGEQSALQQIKDSQMPQGQEQGPPPQGQPIQ